MERKYKHSSLTENSLPITASGIYPQMAVFQELNHPIQTGDVIDVYFDTDIQLRRSPPESEKPQW